MIHLEPDLGYLQRIHEAALVAAGSFNVPLDIMTQACEFLAVLFLCSFHGLGDLVDQTAHVLFHGAPCYGEGGVSSVHRASRSRATSGARSATAGWRISPLPSRSSTPGVASASTACRLPPALVVGMIGVGGSLVAVAMDLFAALLSAALDAELIALWVGEYDPPGAIWSTVIGD